MMQARFPSFLHLFLPSLLILLELKIQKNQKLNKSKQEKVKQTNKQTNKHKN